MREITQLLGDLRQDLIHQRGVGTTRQGRLLGTTHLTSRHHRSDLGCILDLTRRMSRVLGMVEIWSAEVLSGAYLNVSLNSAIAALRDSAIESVTFCSAPIAFRISDFRSVK